MKKIKIISVGNLSPYFKQLFNEYAKNIAIFAEFQNIELKEFSEIKNIEEKKLRETKKVLESIDKNSYVCLLSLRGKQIDSTEFATKLDLSDNWTFIIGGSDGLIEELIKPDLKISFSKMTFPHQLFKIMLSEQIYRAFMIKNNKKYHK